MLISEYILSGNQYSQHTLIVCSSFEAKKLVMYHKQIMPDFCSPICLFDINFESNSSNNLKLLPNSSQSYWDFAGILGPNILRKTDSFFILHSYANNSELTEIQHFALASISCRCRLGQNVIFIKINIKTIKIRDML